MDLADRLTMLVEASLDFADERDPHELLATFLATACRLLDARYGALFIDDGGVLSDFLTWGIDEATERAIGAPPTRTGLHGFLLKGGRTIRSDDLTTDSRATGFPRHHPVMRTFIGTPVRYRSRTLGEIYLAEKNGDEVFTVDDERILEMLAARAGTAYWNAQLLAAERRVSAEVTALLDARERGDTRHSVFRRLAWAEEEERARVGRELHDGLGQILTSAALYAKGIEESVSGEVVDRVSTLRGLIERAMASTRALIRGLRPPELDHLGVVAALERLTAEVRDTHGLRVDLHGTDVEVPPDVETAVYRITQEALTNVVRHAGATWASVVVGAHDGHVVVVIEDDGKGFDRDTLMAHGMRHEQLGLLGMAQRAAAVGATLTVDSEVGHGTLVRFEVPVGQATG